MSSAQRRLVLLYGVAAFAGQAMTIVWMKRLTLVLGMSVPAVCIVLAGYLLLFGGGRPLAPMADGLLRRFIATGGAVAAWAAEAPINTEDYLLIEYRVPRLFRWLDSDVLWMENLRQLSAIQQEATELSPGLAVSPGRGARHLYAGVLARGKGDFETAYREMLRAVESDPGSLEARRGLDLERDRRVPRPVRLVSAGS